jgi:hypothetical protein
VGFEGQKRAALKAALEGKLYVATGRSGSGFFVLRLLLSRRSAASHAAEGEPRQEVR